METIKDIADKTISKALQKIIHATGQTASCPSIEEICIDKVSILRTEADYIWYRASGIIEDGQQQGANSDICQVDGTPLSYAFPFQCDIPATVNNPKTLDPSMIDLRISTGGWHAQGQANETSLMKAA